MDWYALIERLNFKTLIPVCYERFVPLVIDGLAWFLSNLNMDRQTQIFNTQVSMGPFATTSERLEKIMQSCPTLHKLGQVLARDSRLNEELRNSLKELETMPSKFSRDDTVSILSNSGIDVSQFLFEENPIAEASVAIVIPFKRIEQNEEMVEGVFKVIKPEARDFLEEELELWPNLGDALKSICKEKKLPVLEFSDPLNETAQMVAQEVNLRVEQENLKIMSNNYLDSRQARVPHLLPWCTDKVTSMERIEGLCVGDLLKAPIDIRREIAERIFNSLIAAPFWQNKEKTIFHGDPHAGNLLVDKDGKIVPLDWSLTVALNRKERELFIEIMFAGLKKDKHRLVRALKKIGKYRGVKNEINSVVERSICALSGHKFPSFDWLLGLLDDALENGRLSLNGNFALFRKSLFSILSVIKEIYPEISTDKILLKTGFEKLISEWPFRAFSDPFSKEWGTHLSNAQILELLSSWPTLYTNFWLGCLKKT